MNRRHVGASALAMCVALAACGDSGVEIEGDVLAEAEAQALAGVIFGETLANVDFSGAQASVSAAGAPVNFDDEFSLEDAPCPLGGTVSLTGDISGTVDDETNEGEITLSITEVHSDCMAEAEEEELIFTLNGAPNLGVDLTMSFSEGQFAFSGSFSGGIDWATDDGRSGICPVDLSFEAEASESAQSGSGAISGSVCGVNITRDASWSPAT